MKKVDLRSFLNALVLGLIISPFWFWAFFLYRDGGQISTRLVQRIDVEAGGFLELGFLIFLSLFFIPCVLVVSIGLVQFLVHVIFGGTKSIFRILSPLWSLVKVWGRLLGFVFQFLWLEIVSRFHR